MQISGRVTWMTFVVVEQDLVVDCVSELEFIISPWSAYSFTNCQRVKSVFKSRNMILTR